MFYSFQDSYVLKYFESMNKYLSVGSPVYFVVQAGHDYTTLMGQNEICGASGCPDYSLLGQVYEATRKPNWLVEKSMLYYNFIITMWCYNEVSVYLETHFVFRYSK